MDEHRISGSADLRNRIGLAPVGSQVTVEYLRDGSRKTLALRVEPEDGNGDVSSMPRALEGAHFQDAAGKVVVTGVEDGSAAARAGLEAGDVIVAVNRRPVGSTADLAAALKEVTGTLALDLFRDGMRWFLVVR